MSNDPNNNSGNNPPDPQQVLSWNGGGWQTVNIPLGNAAAANPVTYTFTIGGGNTQQIPLPNLDLDLPVAEKKKNSDGCFCKKCKELFPYAEPNQEDGTLVCYGCRMTW